MKEGQQGLAAGLLDVVVSSQKLLQHKYSTESIKMKNIINNVEFEIKDTFTEGLDHIVEWRNSKREGWRRETFPNAARAGSFRKGLISG